jgi:hypothetical protein
VLGVDDIGSLLMRWDNGSGLNALYLIDTVRKLRTIKTVCYGEEQIWDDRAEAEAYFLEAMFGSDGSERERYTNIYQKLLMGLAVCSDNR